METTDILIIGSGIAGLSLAVKLNSLNPELKISIVTKATASECNTRYAQGGIAAVMNKLSDSYENHINDTLKCGKGLCDVKIVELVVRQAPERINELVKLGVRFDHDIQNNFELGLEGGHSTPRIVHHKDKTGFEVETVLIQQIKSRKNISISDNLTVVDLLMGNKNGVDSCTGAILYEHKTNKVFYVYATATVLASGGCGQVYLNTTNPDVATGDGYAIAKRAGATIKNMRFMQFHPTALFQEHEEGTQFLISEAMRGFGAHIIDADGKRFLYDYDPRGELATRDIVSAAIQNQMKRTHTNCVYMDLKHIDKKDCEMHFPQITEHLIKLGYDISKDLIPVVPSAHYQCGGVAVDENAQSTITDLYAVGEVAYTGLHGANRLASNSLLEALVFSHNAAKKIASDILAKTSFHIPSPADHQVFGLCVNPNIEIFTNKIKRWMSDIAFDVNPEKQKEVLLKIEKISRDVENEIQGNHYSFALLNLRNMALTAQLILKDKLQSEKDQYQMEGQLEESII